jgi:Mn2+/Fe2+ NRAMP family transporter
MGQLLKNKTLNYWVCGLIFTIVFGIVTAIVAMFTDLLIFSGLLYLIVMPYVSGRLVDFVSDKWMD